jgi:chromosome segregation ATPase
VVDANERADTMSKDATQSTQELSDKLHAAQDALSKATEEVADRGIKAEALQRHLDEVEARLQSEKARSEGERAAAKEAAEAAGKAVKQLEAKCRDLEEQVREGAAKSEQLEGDKSALAAKLAELEATVQARARALEEASSEGMELAQLRKQLEADLSARYGCGGVCMWEGGKGQVRNDGGGAAREERLFCPASSLLNPHS